MSALTPSLLNDVRCRITFSGNRSFPVFGALPVLRLLLLEESALCLAPPVRAIIVLPVSFGSDGSYVKPNSSVSIGCRGRFFPFKLSVRTEEQEEGDSPRLTQPKLPLLSQHPSPRKDRSSSTVLMTCFLRFRFQLLNLSITESVTKKTRIQPRRTTVLGDTGAIQIKPLSRCPC